MSTGPRVIPVIESETVRGCGDPAGRCPVDHVHEICRLVVQYHTLNGKLLAERDDVLPEQRRIR